MRLKSDRPPTPYPAGEAERRKITIPDAKSRSALASSRSPAKRPRSNQRCSRAQLMRRGARIDVDREMLYDEFRAHHVQPTDAQIKQYYEEHRDLFVKIPGEDANRAYRR